jgi:hypothetical protein
MSAEAVAPGARGKRNISSRGSSGSKPHMARASGPEPGAALSAALRALLALPSPASGSRHAQADWPRQAAAAVSRIASAAAALEGPLLPDHLALVGQLRQRLNQVVADTADARESFQHAACHLLISALEAFIIRDDPSIVSMQSANSKAAGASRPAQVRCLGGQRKPCAHA